MQTTYTNGGEAVTLTTAQIYWPNGTCIHGRGITENDSDAGGSPQTVAVENNADYGNAARSRRCSPRSRRSGGQSGQRKRSGKKGAARGKFRAQRLLPYRAVPLSLALFVVQACFAGRRVRRLRQRSPHDFCKDARIFSLPRGEGAAASAARSRVSAARPARRFGSVSALSSPSGRTRTSPRSAKRAAFFA